MKVFTNTTSPYARIARIALIESGKADLDVRVVDPMKDDPEFLAVNSAGRVPALVTDAGTSLTESLLVVLWLEMTRQGGSFVTGDVETIIAQTGVAMGVIDAAVHIIVGRAIVKEAFDESSLGLRRRRSILTGLKKLDDAPPLYSGELPSLSVIAAVVAAEYASFRFSSAGWLVPFPRLANLSLATSGRFSFTSTQPYLPEQPLRVVSPRATGT
jgi:glutathione S-transferase